MKRYKSLVGSLISLSLFAGSLCSGATTDPVGANAVTINPGNVLVACPYVHNNSYVGTVSSVTDGTGQSTITVTGTPFSAAEFSEGSFPLYYLELTESGHINEGYSFDIISNSTNSITVAGELAATYGVDVNDEIQIRKHMTLEDFFSDADLTAYVDTVKFFNSDGSITLHYYWQEYVEPFGYFWTTDGGTSDSGDQPIYPGTGFLATFNSQESFVISGTVKTTKTVVPVYSNPSVINLIASSSPVNETFGSLDLANSGLSDYVGTVKSFLSDGSLSVDTLYYDFGSFLTSDGSTAADDTQVSPSEAFVTSNSGSDTIIILPKAYSQ